MPKEGEHTVAVLRLGNPSGGELIIETLAIGVANDTQQKTSGTKNLYMNTIGRGELLEMLDEKDVGLPLWAPTARLARPPVRVLGLAAGTTRLADPRDVYITEQELAQYLDLEPDLSDVATVLGRDRGNYNTARSNAPLVIPAGASMTILVSFPGPRIPHAAAIRFSTNSGVVIRAGHGMDATRTQTPSYIALGAAFHLSQGKASGSKGGFAVGGFSPAVIDKPKPVLDKLQAKQATFRSVDPRS